MAVHHLHAVLAGKRFRVEHAWDEGALPSAHLASLSVIDVAAGTGAAHIGLPHDLYMVTAYCDEQLDCRAANDDGPLRVMVSALRTRPVAFGTRGEGQMAVALLSPLGLLRAFGCPLQDLENTRLSLRELVSAPAEAALHGALRDAASAGERSAVLGHWLEGRIAEHRRLGFAAERVAAAAMSLLCGAATPIDELARRHATSRRQLERDFHHWLGVTPGAYARLVRFQRAAGAVADGVPLAHVAADHGYADQAHMTRTFREIAGITPREVRRRAAGTDGLRSALANRTVMLADVGAGTAGDRLAA